MLNFPRGAVARFVTVLRRGHPRSTPAPPVVVQSGPDVRSLVAVTERNALRLTVPGGGPSWSAAIGTEALAVVAADEDGDVTLQPGSRGINAEWTERGVPFSRQLPTVPIEECQPFPELPAQWAPLNDAFLAALAAAVPLAAKDATRYALNCLALDGRNRQLVVTDSKVLLSQGPWPFPWDDLVLVPASPILASREWRGSPVTIRRTDTHLGIQAGPWTLVVRRNTNGRFPAYAEIVPKPRQLRTQVQLGDGDVDLLFRQLPRLPVADPDLPGVTVNTGAQVEVTTAGAAMPLPGAVATGPAQRLHCDRRHLLKALRLGFTRLAIADAQRPAVFHAAGRQFVFMPLTPPDEPNQESPNTPETSAMAAPTITPSPSNNGNHAAADPLTDAEEVRGLLREADVRMTRLVAHLKHQRRHARALRTAVDSLRALPDLAIPAEK